MSGNKVIFFTILSKLFFCICYSSFKLFLALINIENCPADIPYSIVYTYTAV